MFDRRLVDKDIEDWIFEQWGMLHQRLGPEKPLGSSAMVLPRPGEFGSAASTPTETAQRIFDRVQQLAGLENWPVKLESFEALKPEQVSEYVFLAPEQQQAAGLFITGDGNEPIIRYDLDAVNRPMDLIATFAHELAHYLLIATQIDTGDMGEEAELLTDLAAVYMGFGVFLANSAFEFGGHQGFYGSGWSSKRQGYLSENSLLVATALFARTSGNDPEEATPYLKSRLHKSWKKALKQVDRRQDVIEGLRKADNGFAEKLSPA